MGGAQGKRKVREGLRSPYVLKPPRVSVETMTPFLKAASLYTLPLLTFMNESCSSNHMSSLLRRETLSYFTAFLSMSFLSKVSISYFVGRKLLASFLSYWIVMSDSSGPRKHYGR